MYWLGLLIVAICIIIFLISPNKAVILLGGLAVVAIMTLTKQPVNGGGNTNILVANWNILSDTASKFALGGLAETQPEWDSRHKKTCDIITSKLNAYHMDIVALEEVTDNFKNILDNKINALNQTKQNKNKYQVFYEGIRDKNNPNKIFRVQMAIILDTDIYFDITSNYIHYFNIIKYDKFTKIQVMVVENMKTYDKIAFINVHLNGDPNNVSSREDALVSITQTCINLDLPYIIIGDMNDELFNKNKIIGRVFGPVLADNNGNFTTPTKSLKTSYSKFHVNNNVFIDKKDLQPPKPYWEALDKILTTGDIKINITYPPNGLDGMKVPYDVDKNTFQRKNNSTLWPSDHTLNIYKISFT